MLAISMLDFLFAEIAESNWLVSNLFQLADGSWQANLRSETHHTGWGQGPSPAIALSIAIDLIAEAIESAPTEPTCVSTLALPSHEPIPLAALFANLRPKASAFNLRVKL